MRKIVQSLLASAPLAVTPALLANGQTTDAIGSIGPAAFAFSLAGALLLTLFLRSLTTHCSGVLTARFGRWRIQKLLSQHGEEHFHDFLLPGVYGGLAKVDHAILTSSGIVCIQSKHVNGRVFAAADEAQWTNIDGTTRRRFLNPVIQNEGRVRALRKIVPDVPVISVVVFTGSVKFRDEKPGNVIHIRDLGRTLEKFAAVDCTFEDWDSIWMNVKAAALTDSDTRKDFAAQLGFS